MVKHYWIGDVGECKLNPSTYFIISTQVSDYGLACFMTHVTIFNVFIATNAISNVLIGTIGSMGYQALKLDKFKEPNTKLNV
jgi:hypothetical protein